MALVLPSQLPLPLLSITLDCLFTNFQPPSISLMSAPILTTVAAGLRAALVVDIGWAETIVTSVYEYREIQSARSVRASKLFGEEMFRMLAQLVDPTAFEEDSTTISREARNILSFEECEEVISRAAWCKPGKKIETEPAQGLAPVQEEDELRSSMRSLNLNAGADATISIPLNSTTPPKTIQVPFEKLAEPCETALFAAGRLPQDLDDEELPLHLLVYRSLLQLPVDIRSLCMSRFIFVGGGSNLLGLKERILNDVNALVERRGWDPVQGRAVEQFRSNPKLQQGRNKQAGTGPVEIPQELDGSSKSKKVIAALADQEYDPIEEGIRREASKGTKPVEQGYLRAVESLGAWSGASLISQLKIPAISLIDREQWLQHGAAGASRGTEVSMASQRQSMGPGLKSGAGERSSWTLGLWG
jgi:actin-related protein